MDLGGPCVGVLLDKSEARQEESLNVFDNKNNRDCAGTRLQDIMGRMW